MSDYFSLTGISQYLEDLKRDADACLSPFATPNVKAQRLFTKNLSDDVIRSQFGIDIDKILHNVLYNRYADKTQVFSFYHNDDITRRALHVQLVSRIARSIGRILKLNMDLIEAIALGHDIGHTPFGHRGERILSRLFQVNAGRYFHHNVHSVRVFKDMTRTNLSLQTYDGILCHCGEKAFSEYRPDSLCCFEEFEIIYKKCYNSEGYINTLRPSTLEGCVVRIADMVAYVGKDRQDAEKAGLTELDFEPNLFGRENYEIIRAIIANIVKNSIDEYYLKMDTPVYEALEQVKDENYRRIYENPEVTKEYDEVIEPMMANLYGQLLADIAGSNQISPVFTHHILNPNVNKCYFLEGKLVEEPNQIVVDYIASMTDDYFLTLYRHLFPHDELNAKIRFHEYF